MVGILLLSTQRGEGLEIKVRSTEFCRTLPPIFFEARLALVLWAPCDPNPQRRARP
jgi:hypothetical protein